MRLVFAVFVLAAAGIFITPASAGRWCAISNEGYTNCSYPDQPQCRAQVAGSGGNCMPEAPVANVQPRAIYAKNPGRDEKFDAMLDRVNKKNDKLILCRGC
jgi:hypothetical protein